MTGFRLGLAPARISPAMQRGEPFNKGGYHSDRNRRQGGVKVMG